MLVVVSPPSTIKGGGRPRPKRIFLGSSEKSKYVATLRELLEQLDAETTSEGVTSVQQIIELDV
ncbi:hypothetical protein Taro_000406 [Colocasia esculenta]|uniref:Uncharacterized protein n=1 Tax=Colocasia esculenta TaxID=4460 RepID=A0A843TCZ5_COLES|nr:hypothetical protein [Colocasia esculenta]